MTTGKTPTLNAEHFYKFFQCPHWIWYDIYGEATKKKKVPAIVDLIYKGKTVVAGEKLREHKKFDEIKPELYRDIEEAFLTTLEMMKQGKNIYHGALMYEDWAGIPDLLEARPGKSDLGDWHYVVYDVQSSLDLRDEYKFQLIFYSLILEKLQGVRPKEAYVIDPNGNERSFKVDDFIEQFHLTREQIGKILEGEKPAPFLKSSCKRTPWYSLCLSETQGCNDVSLIYKMSQADQRRLYGIGIRTVDDMAKSDVNDLQSKLEDWPFDKLVRFNNQAKVLSSTEPMILKKGDFPEVENEIYFDIESDPMRDIDYLLGYLVKNKKGEVKYNYFLANGKEDEEKIWKKFLDFLAGLENFVIYHYAFYERTVFDRLALRYGAPLVLVDKFKDNTIDLHSKLVESAVLPLYFYSLKDVAGYLGYKWDDPGAGGAESVVWYNDWLEKHDDAIMKKILKYNEDDVRATFLIKEWLQSQKPSKQKEKLDLDNYQQ
jgi:predicted RecB family nuclease